MHPLVKGAALIGLLAAPGLILAPAAGDSARPGPPAVPLATSASAGAPQSALQPGPPGAADGCPERTLPLGGPCIPLPEPDQPVFAARHVRLARGTPPPTRFRLGDMQEHIPRLPDRPAEYHRYQLPVESVQAVVASAPSAGPAAEDGPGIRIETEPDSAVRVVAVEGQQDNAVVRLVGQLYGVTVVTSHLVATAAGEREYLIFYGNLARPGPQVVSGQSLAKGAIVGYVGDDESPQGAYLYIETRQLRQSLGPAQAVLLSDLASPNVSVPVDPRNVLPLLPEQ